MAGYKAGDTLLQSRPFAFVIIRSYRYGGTDGALIVTNVGFLAEITILRGRNVKRRDIPLMRNKKGRLF